MIDAAMRSVPPKTAANPLRSPLRGSALAQRACRLLLRAMFKLPESWLRRIAGPARRQFLGGEALRELDPRARIHAWLVTRFGSAPASDPVDARRPRLWSLSLLEGAPIPMRDCHDLILPGPGGPLNARLYTPPSCPQRAPALVYLHFGGCVVGDLDTCHTACSILAHHGRFKVLSVAYRLAPEHKFPAAVEDAAAALRWLRNIAPELGIDADQIGIGGDSAGGYLAASASLLLARSGEPAPKMQLLIYPVLEMDRLKLPASPFDRCYPLTRADMVRFAAQYMRAPEDADDPLCSVARAPSLAAMPPTLLIQARHDLLFDEGRDFATRLQAEGVPLMRRVHPTLSHAFSAMSGGLPAAREALVETAVLAGTALRAPINSGSRIFMETCDE